MKTLLLYLAFQAVLLFQQGKKIYSQFEVDTKAEPKKGWSNFFKEFQAKANLKEFNTWEALRNDTGCFKIHFVVETDGRLVHKVYSQCLSQALQNEIKIGLEKCESWKPAIKHGQKVRQEAYMALDFMGE